MAHINRQSDFTMNIIKKLVFRNMSGDTNNSLQTFHGRMFVEDVHNEIMPFPNSGLREYPEFGIGTTPSDIRVGATSIDEAIATAISDGWGHYGTDLVSAVPDFFREIIHDLLLLEEVDCDLHLIIDHNAPSETGTVAINLPVGFRIIRRGTHYTGKLGRNRSLLPESQTVTFSLPSHWKRIINQMMAKFRATHDSHMMPEFARDSISGQSKVPFAFDEFSRTDKRATLQACHEVGWDARMMLTQGISTYHYIYRKLKFQHFLIDVRQKMLDDLNLAVNKAGSLLNFQTKIVVRGLPTHESVDELQKHLELGTMTFKELTHRI